MSIADQVIEKYRNQPLPSEPASSQSLSDRIIERYKGGGAPQPVVEEPATDYMSTFKRFVGGVLGVGNEIAKGLVKVPVKVTTSLADIPTRGVQAQAREFKELFKTGDIKKAQQASESAYGEGGGIKKYALPWLGDVETYQSEAGRVAGEIVEGKKPLHAALKPFVEVPADVISTFYFPAKAGVAAKGGKIWQGVKSGAKVGSVYGGAYGAAQAIGEGKDAKEIASKAFQSLLVGAAAGGVLGGGTAAVGKAVEKIIGKGKKTDFISKIDEIKGKYTPVGEKTMADVTTKRAQKVNLRPELKQGGRLMQDVVSTAKKTPKGTPVDEIIAKSGFVDMTVNPKKSIKMVGGGNAKGRSRFDFKTGRGKIEVAVDASDATKAHEFAHVANYKLGGGKDKLTNLLSDLKAGKGKMPEAIKSYARKELGKGVTEDQVNKKATEIAGAIYDDIAKASRIDKSVEFRLKNKSEEFSTAFGNLIEKSDDVEKVAPTFAKFMKSEVMGGATGKASVIKKTGEAIYRESVEGMKKTYEGTQIVKDGKLSEKLVKGRVDDIAQKLEKSQGAKVASEFRTSMEGKTFKDYDEFSKVTKELLEGKPALKNIQEVPISKLKSIEGDREMAMADFKAGKKSKTDLPVLVRKEKDGSLTVLDGNGRIIQAQSQGQKNIKITTDEVAYRKILEAKEAKEVVLNVARGEGSAFQAKIQGSKGQPMFGEGKYFSEDENVAKEFGKITKNQIRVKPSEILDIQNQKDYEALMKNALKEFPDAEDAITAYAKAKGYKIIRGGKDFDFRAGINVLDESVLAKPSVKPTIVSAGGKVPVGNKPIKSESIRLDKLNTSDDVKNTINKISTMDKEVIDAQRRGRISARELDELSEMTGLKTKDILDAKAGSIVNAENARATRKMMLNMAGDLSDFSRELAAKGRPATQAELGIFRRKLDTFRGVQRSLAGFRSEAGRLLQSFSQEVAPQEYEMMDDLIKQIQKIDSSSADDVAKALRIGKQLAPDNLFQLAVKSGIDVRTAFLLYSPTTHVANIVGNTWQAITAPMKKYIASKMYKGRGVVKGEASAHIQGVADAMPEAWANLGDDLKAIFKGEEISGGFEKISEVTRQRSVKEFMERIGAGGKVADKTDSVLKSSFKLLTVADKFFRTINFAGELYSQALRKAKHEGLQGDDLARRITQLMDDPRVDQTFFDDIQKQVSISLFQERTALSKSVNKVREGIPATKLIFPFVQTPLNVAMETVRTSPLGFLRPALAKGRGAAMNEAEKGLAYAQASIGTALSLAGLAFVNKGKITGSAPTNVAERDEFYASGKQPYSIKVGDQWVSYRRIEPLASVLANTVNAYTTMKNADDWQSAVGKSVSGYANNFFDQTFLRGISDVYNAISDPKRYGKRFVQSFATSFVPSIIRSGAAAEDRTIRETETMSDAFKNVTPFKKKELPAQVDIFGREIKREGGFVEGLISPFQRAKEPEDKTSRELAKSDYNLTTTGLEKIGGVEIEGKAKEVWMKAVGKETKKELDKLVNSSYFDKLSQFQKDEALKDTVDRVREKFRKQVMVGNLKQSFDKRKKMTKSEEKTYNQELSGSLSKRVEEISLRYQ